MKFNVKKCHILSTRNKSQFFCSLDNEILKHVPNSRTSVSSSHQTSTRVAHTHITTSQKEPQDCRCIPYLSLFRSTLEYGSII